VTSITPAQATTPTDAAEHSGRLSPNHRAIQ